MNVIVCSCPFCVYKQSRKIDDSCTMLACVYESEVLRRATRTRNAKYFGSAYDGYKRYNKHDKGVQTIAGEKNIFEEGELSREGNVQILHIANSDRPVEFYNLDVIISVGYRVKSKRGTQFRIWATGILKEYMRKGFALDDERLKNLGGGSYLYKSGYRKGIYGTYHVCRKPADFAGSRHCEKLAC